MSNFANEHDLIMQCNLPSRRWKKRRIIEAQDKRLLILEKECKHLRNQIANLEYITLDPPIQRGYKRSFVLSEDTKHSKRADFYQNILNKINTEWYSPHKSFQKTKKRRVKKWKFQKVKEQHLQEPDNWSFHQSKKYEFTKEEKALFYAIEYYDYPAKMWRKRYIFSEPWRFVLRVRPNMITQIQRKDSILEQTRDFLNDYLSQHAVCARLVKLHGSPSKSWMGWRGQKDKYKYDPLKNKPLWKIYETYEDEVDIYN